jgi:hypothetical protein
VCGGQQDSGSACVASRGNDGAITVREWHPVGAEEYGYVAPDPNDPDIVYGGKLSRFDRRTGQVQDVMPPRDDHFRVLRTAPLLFSPLDSRTLFFASNVLWKTTTGGQSWTALSGDLSRETWDVPATVGVYRATPDALPTRRGVIYAVAPSPVEANVLWAGTDDGLIHVTHDAGRTWTNVTPSSLTPWAKVSILEASHFDVNSAYAAINTLRLDDLNPHILRTRDGGRTWVAITRGLPKGGIINVVREDSQRRGLLFAGSEQAVFVSFDDGESWQPLRLNMPATSIRDLVVHGEDLVVGTHGRSFWILDDVSPLRQMSAEIAAAPAHLFDPRPAIRFPRNTNTDTPLPPEEPGGKNPPDGAILYYYLKSAPASPAVLEIADTSGRVVRRYSSADRAPQPPPMPVASYWLRPFQPLSAEPGMHRFVWDLHAAPAGAGGRGGAPISAIFNDTPIGQGEWMPPGVYTVRLTVDGKVYTRELRVKPDPRQ